MALAKLSRKPKAGIRTGNRHVALTAGGKAASEARPSFLKKRSKRLLALLSRSFPQRALKGTKFFRFFFSKKNRLLLLSRFNIQAINMWVRLPRAAKVRIAIACCMLSACSAGPQAASVPAACHLDRVADLPMAPGTPYAVVPARLDDQPVSMLIDTGDERLTIRQQAVGRLRLAVNHRARTTVHGLGGDATNFDVILQRFELGGTEIPQSGAAVAEIPLSAAVDPPLSGIIGAQTLSDYEVEFDFPARRVTLWQRSECDKIEPAWTGAWSSALLQRSTGSLMTLAVTIDGRSVRALLDTGARSTTIDIEAASQLGMTAAGLAGAKLSVSRGADGNDVFGHTVRLGDIAVGTSHTTGFPVLVSPVHPPFADMLLGVDFLQSRDLWIAYAGQRVFIK